MVKLFGGDARGQSPFAYNVLFDKHEIHNLIPFLVKINNKNNYNNHDNGNNFLFLSIFFHTSFQRSPEVAPGARAPLPSPSYPTGVMPLYILHDIISEMFKFGTTMNIGLKEH